MSFLNEKQIAKVRKLLRVPVDNMEFQKEFKRLSEQTLVLMAQNEALREKCERLEEQNIKLKKMLDILGE